MNREEAINILNEVGANKEYPETVNEAINTEGMMYKKIHDCVGTELIIKGFFFTKSKFGGLNVVVVTDDYLINMPQRAVDVFKKVADNERALALFKNGYYKITNIKSGHSKKYNSDTTYYDIVPTQN